MIKSDRGAQFTSKLYYDTLKEYGIIQSMSRPHTPADNVDIETFWKTMKVEIGKVKQLTVEEYMMIIDYYMLYYNTKRPHSGIGYMSPLIYRYKTT